METRNRPSKKIERPIRRPSLEIGGETFLSDQIKDARIRFHIDEYMEHRTASVILNLPTESRWDYHAEVKLYEEKDVILAGTCAEAKQDEEGNLRLELAGPFWKLERTRIGSFETFGMRRRESLYWMIHLSSPGRPPVFSDLDLDVSPRPFKYTIPLKGLPEFNEGLLLVGDIGITSQENDNEFNLILDGADSIREEDAWNQENPRIFGAVVAEDLIHAEQVALERANSLISIINFGLSTGMSHFETRYSTEPIQFDAENSLSLVELHPWIAICEVQEAKGWIRHISPIKLEAEKAPDNSVERIKFFLSKFFTAGQPGDIYDQTGRRIFQDREQKLLIRTKRALHWLNLAAQQENLRDKFAATWISLESILDSIDYPEVFAGERSEIKRDIRKKIKELSIPSKPEKELSITTEMLLTRTLQNQWPLTKKLLIFSNALGINLEKSDTALVGELSRARGKVFHAGENNSAVTHVQVAQLKYLVERLVAATSIGGYEDLEGQPHKLQIGQIGPEGGAAPISIDGKEVAYELHMYRDEEERAKVEWMAEGKIYTERDIYLEKISDDP